MENRERSQEIAQTILEQLGGNKFRAMTGAHSFMSKEAGLVFKFPNGKNRIFALEVNLRPDDTYEMKFFKKKGRYNVEVAKEYQGVYCDMLQSLFTDETGLDTRL